MKKIMFNDKYHLTRAVLDGRKTQTRRMYRTPANAYGGLEVEGNNIISYSANGEEIVTAPRYKIGEIVAIAQSYQSVGYNAEEPLQEKEGYYVHTCNALGWRNKMFVRAEFMPHQIRITDVRMERLHDISDEDCLKEGIERLPEGGGFKPYSFYDTSIKMEIEDTESYGWYRDYNTPREAYAALTDKVCGKGTWDSNPYVWVYDFELIK